MNTEQMKTTTGKRAIASGACEASVLAEPVSDDLKWIQALLRQWGLCMAGNPCRQVGYPSANILHKAYFGSSGHDPEWSREVYRVEHALTILGIEDAKALKILKAFYIFNNSYHSIGSQYGVHYTTAWRWVGNYEARVAEIYQSIDAKVL